MTTARQKLRKQRIEELRQEGRDAYDAGVPLRDCPYRFADGARWAEGWNSQKEFVKAKSVVKDAERLDYLEQRLFEKRWNGVIDSGSRIGWMIAGDYRHTTQHFVGETLRSAIDAAMLKEGRV